MELVISNKIKNCLRNTYVIKLEFMFGDAEEFDELFFYFTKESYSDVNFKEKVHEFIKHLQSAINIDSKGRLGIDTYYELGNWYGFGFDRCDCKYSPVYKWGKYCEDSLEYNEKLLDSFDETSQFTYSIPTNYYEFFASYYDFDILYYDESGDLYDVKIIE